MSSGKLSQLIDKLTELTTTRVKAGQTQGFEYERLGTLRVDALSLPHHNLVHVVVGLSRKAPLPLDVELLHRLTGDSGYTYVHVCVTHCIRNT